VSTKLIAREIKKKLGGRQTGGQAKIWGGHGPPRSPLEPPLPWMCNQEHSINQTLCIRVWFKTLC